MSAETIPKLLLVDDEVEICSILQEFFESKYSVRVAHNLAEAEEILSEHEPDLILLDMLLQGENGMDYLKRLKRRDPNVKVFVITALQDENVREEALQSGALRVFLKPIDLLEVLQAVQTTAGPG